MFIKPYLASCCRSFIPKLKNKPRKHQSSSIQLIRNNVNVGVQDLEPLQNKEPMQNKLICATENKFLNPVEKGLDKVYYL